MHDTWTVAALEKQGIGPLNVKVTLVACTDEMRTSIIWTTLTTAPALGSLVRFVVVPVEPEPVEVR